MITIKSIKLTLPTDGIRMAVKSAVETAMTAQAPNFNAAVAANVPSPDRPGIHIYAKGKMKASLRTVVDTSGPLARIVITADSRSAPYADEGYTRKGEKTAKSWGLRGDEGHGGDSYMVKGADPLLQGLADAITTEAAQTIGGG